MALQGFIRHAYFDQVFLKEIAIRLVISRNSFRRYLHLVSLLEVDTSPALIIRTSSSPHPDLKQKLPNHERSVVI